MATVQEFNRFGEEIEKLMLLRTSPLAVKMLEKVSDIPDGAIRPKADQGYHFAQCQAFSLSRKKGQAIAMLKEDNWCWGSLVAYGLVDQLRMFEERKMGYRHNALWEIMPDFPRPDFYKKFSRECGLDADDVPTWPAH